MDHDRRGEVHDAGAADAVHHLGALPHADEERLRECGPGDAADRAAGKADDEGLDQEQKLHLARRCAQGAQGADVAPPAVHGDVEGVEDEEDADGEGEGAGDVEPGGEVRHEALHLLAAPGRGFHPVRRAERFFKQFGPLRHGHPIGQPDVDAVETASPAEELLRGVDVHHHEVAAEGLRESLGAHEAARGHLPDAGRDPDRQRPPGGETGTLGEVAGEKGGVGLGQEQERVVEVGVVALEAVVAHLAVPEEIDADHHETAEFPLFRDHDLLDHRRCCADTGEVS